MHADQLDLGLESVAGLVAERLPQCEGLPLRRVPSHGTVTQLFRLGPDLVLRFPLQGDDVEAGRLLLAEEAVAARRLLGRLPVPTPEPLMLGGPTATCPLPWAVYGWLPGATASHAGVAASRAFAEDLAAVVSALWSMDVEGCSFAGQGRGGPLPLQDDYVDTALRRSRDLIDVRALERLWQRLRTAARTEADTWAHRDLMPGNLLMRGGRLAAVIDVGGLAPADPAIDLMPAWNLLEPPARRVFRQSLDVDDARWERGKAWAFARAVGCLDYYRVTNPVLSRLAHHTLTALLTDEPC
ncbi:aminoglycoside phosphotransferase family protein [Pedococcus sp. 5OH_020]|uniref:aminoglycoside phosphotransferase family protein n=1 Tax=Pedococcus sp. 5OH_020 TaxID=2989814 RepID=UPI0022E9E3DA|nr:aminoglycoside phosphotransferase family protein [Pedococcus sp. 5OH_020]